MKSIKTTLKLPASTVITSPYSNITTLIENDYLCISVTGKVYGDYTGKEEVKRIRGLNTYRFYYNERIKDYYACYLLYRNNLQRLGFNRIVLTIEDLCKEYGKTKIALLGYGEGNSFCYRHILADFLRANGVLSQDLNKISLSAQKELWKQNLYKDRGHFNLTDEFAGKTLETMNWIYAKTMPKNPHYYTLRKEFGNSELFLKLVSHIRYFGKPEIFEGVLFRVFYYNGYRYWEHPCDKLNEDVDLINRKLLV